MKPSQVISLSAVCTAISALCVAVGVSVPMLDYSMFLVASLFIMTPVLAGTYKGGFLSLIASILIGIMICPNFLMVFPYVIFFGPYAILLCFCEEEERSLSPVVKNAIKVVFFVVVELALWKFANFFVDFESLNLPIPVLIILGLGVLFVFDYLMKRVRRQVQYSLWKILKIKR